MSVPYRLYCIFLIVLCALVSCASREIRIPPKQAKVALVLGAGASKGFAHIGVLKVLEANKIPVHVIIGTSAGSFVGSMYAYGHNSFQLQKMSFSMEKGDIIDLVVPDNGFVKGEKLEEFINKTVNNTPLEKMHIPFYAIATDIQNGQEVVFGKGNTGKAVRASCAIPGIFRPVKIENRMYVDGGVVSPVGVDAARRLGADVVIAVDVTSAFENIQPEGTIDTILQSIGIMYAKLAAQQTVRADVVIRPKVGYIAAGDFSKKHEAVLEGEKAALEALPAIQGIIDGLKQQGRL
ncbi:MAG TPA: patatin-like phospholipase family protein [Thermodesulfovibrionales bacterium]|nr:patatin-like phospholipase family protein [Thermodesulfovibrionales bacterium]